MNEITIISTLPAINGNFEEIKTELTEQLKQFDLIVDTDSVKTAKSMATKINKLSGEIDKKRKQVVQELSAPIKEFEAMMKELKDLCQESRLNLLSQVKVYDDKRLDEVHILLTQELQNKYTHYGVEEEFKSVKIDDLIILSHLTQGGSLAKKARDIIDERVSEAKKFQEKVNTRLLTLETICFKGGLAAPLTRENINHFLMVESDDEYLEQLTSLIANEVTRMQNAKELEERIKVTQNVVQSRPSPQVPQQPKQTKPKEVNTKRIMKNMQEFSPKKKKFIVSATFEIEFNDETNVEERLRQMMLKKFQMSGFKTTPNVTVASVK